MNTITLILSSLFLILSFLFIIQSIVFLRLRKRIQLFESINMQKYIASVRSLQQELDVLRNSNKSYSSRLRNIEQVPLTQKEIEEEWGHGFEVGVPNPNYEPTISDLINYLSPPDEDLKICQDICNLLQRSNDRLQQELDDLKNKSN